MSKEYSIDAKVYNTADAGSWSMEDMLNYFVKHGAMRVSDLHIKVGVQPAYRLDGDLMKLRGQVVTPEIAKLLIYSLMSEQQIAELESKDNIDCSYHHETLQFRINVFKDNDGITAAIRALGMDVPKLEDIGFPNEVYKDIVKRQNGLVLLTGITGAGKSTTIASFVDRISELRACRIISLEDPIEYILKQKNAVVSQREVGRDVTSFASGLKAMLREDPDVIFVGEMRDAETVSMTLMAAETGHLVFSTLHTRNVAGTITRVLDYFPASRQDEVRNQLSLGLAYIISQKLVPKKDGTGRLIAMEVLNNSYACANLIRTGKIEQLFSQLQTKTKDNPSERMITFESHLASLVIDKKIDLLEAQKWVNNHQSFIDAMNSYGRG
ncbi:MAG: PilT/PilU family type 4a pilus ATPase [Anaerohalosphaeraceae bacterium]|nr:PilT/PilU family type 4a pilus ATPase [Anaerohalosphaeraceae bacterium]